MTENDEKVVKRGRKTKEIDNKNDLKDNVKDKKVKRVRTKKTETEIRIEDVKKTVEFSLVEVIIIILVTAVLVSIVSAVIVFRNYDKLSIKISSNEGDTSEILEHYNYIIDNYIGEVNKKELIDAAINGMYNYVGDEYTTYMDKNTTDALQEQLGGKYSGIGIEITMIDKNIVINRVFSDSPALKAGLKKGDILTKLDDVDLSDKDSQYVANEIKNNPNKDTFEISYKRDDKEYSTTIKREIVSIDSVESLEYDKVGYIKISTFSSVTASQVETKLNEFSKNVESVVIDLRDNTGGYLNAAYDIADLFLEKGKIVYQLKNRNEQVFSYSAKNGVVRKFKKIVMLVNANSASASEVLTLALKESGNAVVVGTKTFGKGTVQETKVLKSGAMVKYTSAYWLSPKGNSINKIGIQPDVEVGEVDLQLDKAIEAAK